MSEIINKTNIVQKGHVVSADYQRSQVTRDRNSCQALFNKKIQPVTKITSNPIRFFNSISKGSIRVLDKLFWFGYKYDHVFVSQATIGNYVGLSRGHTNYIIQQLVGYGIIHKRRCPYQSNVYKISQYFKQPEIMSLLKSVFSSIRSAFRKNLTLLGLGKKNINILEVSTKKGGNLTTRVFDKLSRILSSIGMKANIPDGNPISVAIRRIKFLNLTKWGQITLSAFPDEAIYYAEKQTQYARSIRKPFDWYFKVCAQYCEDNDLPLDWGYVKELEEHYEMPDDATMLKLACPVMSSRTFQKEKRGDMYTKPKQTEGRQKRFSSFTEQTIVEIPVDELTESAERAMNNEEYVKNAAKLGFDPLHVFNRTHTLAIE